MNQTELQLLAAGKLKTADEIYSEIINGASQLQFGAALMKWMQRITGTDITQTEPALKLCSEIICREFTYKQVPPHLEPSEVSLKKQSLRWLSASSVSRETVILLGFGLSMRLQDVEYFLTRVLLDQMLNPKDPSETIAWYSFKNNLGYHGFCAISEEFAKIDTRVCAQSELSGTLTSKLRRTREHIHSRDELMAYLTRIAVNMEGHVQSMTARRYFMSMYREFYNLAGAPGAGQGGDAHNASVFEKTLYTSTPVRNKNLLSFRDTPLGEMLRSGRLTRQRVGRIVSGASPITRDDLITLRFALDAIKEQNQIARRFVNNADAMLIDCGMSTLSPRVPYDRLLTLCALTGEPLICFDEVLAKCYTRENSDG